MKKYFLSLLPAFFFINNPTVGQALEKTYEKFDFVQGNTILFEDDFQNESLNEIPSYWVASAGRIEVAEIGGAKCLGILRTGSTSPRKKADYSIADKLTIEFDYLIRDNSRTWSKAIEDGAGASIKIQFANDRELYEFPDIQNKLGDFFEDLILTHEGNVRFGEHTGKYTLGQKGSLDIPNDLIDQWVHVSIAINSKSMKVYLNSQRVLNAQINKGTVLSFQIVSPFSSEEENGNQLFIKNVRIAEGGADPYKTMSAEGKFIARGINFDSGRSSLRPESMGAINGIVKMMNADAAVRFEISGHTDSDGDETANLKLSKERAEVVKKKLIEMGIDASRLTAVGYGETKPLTDNSTPEHKANNRRVEFRKL